MLDLESSVAGNETKVDHFEGCVGCAVERWTINGGSHNASFTPSVGSLIADFLVAHYRP